MAAVAEFRKICQKAINPHWALNNLQFLGGFTVGIADGSSKVIRDELQQGFGSVVLSATLGEHVRFGRFSVAAANSNLCEFSATKETMDHAALKAPGGDLILFNDNQRVIDVLTNSSLPKLEEQVYVEQIKEMIGRFNSVKFAKSDSTLSALSDFIAKYSIDENTGFDAGVVKSGTLFDACCDHLCTGQQVKGYRKNVDTYRNAVIRWREYCHNHPAITTHKMIHEIISALGAFGAVEEDDTEAADKEVPLLSVCSVVDVKCWNEIFDDGINDATLVTLSISSLSLHPEN